MINQQKSTLVVIPSDPIVEYEKAGYDWLERYYNPKGMFDKVIALSPMEEGVREAYGMTIVGVKKGEFKKKLKKIKPDIVRAYGGYWPSDLACCNRLFNVPIIVSVHDPNPDNIHISVKKADIVICMSNLIAQKNLRLGIDSSKIRIMPNRIDRTIFYPIENTKQVHCIKTRFSKGKYILHIGRKSREKNLEVIIYALNMLPNDYHCVFVGLGNSGPYRKLAISQGVQDRCIWIDSIKNSELPLWFSWCDCMCTPSLWEGFGIVFIEAAACGAAIVTSDIAPMNEYLSHDVSAYLVKDFKNPMAIAQAIRKVCEDLTYRNEICKGALEASKPFDRELVDQQEMEIYQEAMTKSKRTSFSSRMSILMLKSKNPKRLTV